jgi:hypothetical protein
VLQSSILAIVRVVVAGFVVARCYFLVAVQFQSVEFLPLCLAYQASSRLSPKLQLLREDWISGLKVAKSDQIAMGCSGSVYSAHQARGLLSAIVWFFGSHPSFDDTFSSKNISLPIMSSFTFGIHNDIIFPYYPPATMGFRNMIIKKGRQLFKHS